MHTILIIDDDVVNSKIIELMLTGTGCFIETAGTGTEGIHKFDDMYFDLVITDMQMPEMDGNEVALHIRNSERPRTPIIGMSSNPQFFKKDNFNLLIKKPFSQKGLTASVMSLINSYMNVASQVPRAYQFCEAVV